MRFELGDGKNDGRVWWEEGDGLADVSSGRMGGCSLSEEVRLNSWLRGLGSD